MDNPPAPGLVVLSTLFPNAAQPNAGLFVRERMFRVGAQLPLFVVAPQPWFPLDGLIRRFRSGFRPEKPGFERQQGFDVYFPKYLSVPGYLKHLDGFFMAVAVYLFLKRRRHRFAIIDAHFAYPEGYAATLLGRWLRVPVTMTLRGTEPRMSRLPRIRRRMQRAFGRATRIFSVSDSLRRLALSLGAAEDKTEVVGNGVDLSRFKREDRIDARVRLGLPASVPVLISVGGLVERKGFHRVLAVMPALQRRYPELRYLIVGGASPEGDMTETLQEQARELGLGEAVIFAGPIPPDDLRWYLSAADVFVLATRNEGWANVFLEAMACGLPVVTTDVGGNREVVCADDLGIVVPFDDADALREAIATALASGWDREAIVDYAARNTWDARVEVLVARFREIDAAAIAGPARTEGGRVGRVRT